MASRYRRIPPSVRSPAQLRTIHVSAACGAGEDDLATLASVARPFRGDLHGLEYLRVGCAPHVFSCTISSASPVFPGSWCRGNTGTAPHAQKAPSSGLRCPQRLSVLPALPPRQRRSPEHRLRHDERICCYDAYPANGSLPSTFFSAQPDFWHAGHAADSPPVTAGSRPIPVCRQASVARSPRSTVVVVRAETHPRRAVI